MASNNVTFLTKVMSDFYKYHRDYYVNSVLPYLKDTLKQRLSRLEEGDRITLHTIGGGWVDVVVTKDMRSTVAEAPGLPTVMWVRKPRGRKEGTLGFLKDHLYYQATLRTQTQRVIWFTLS